MSMPALPRRAALALMLAAASSSQAQRAVSLHDPERLLLVDAPAGAVPGRTLRIYLPPSYATHPQQRYPVIYLHDGQNLFDDASSFAGEWGVDETLDQLAGNGFEAIAVGIDHGGAQRNRELSPWHHPRIGQGQGFAYLRWVVETAKPLVDARFRSRPEPGYTAMLGSSLGALVTHAALHRHRDVFGLGALLSPAFWVDPQQASRLAESEPLFAHQRVYVYGGGRESAEMLPQARHMVALLQQQARAVRWVENAQGQHREADWRAVLPQALAHLFEPD